MLSHSKRRFAVAIVPALLVLFATAAFADEKYEEVWHRRKQLADGHYAEAERTFGSAVRLSPKEVYPRFGRALARRALKDYQGVVQDCTDALGLGVKKASITSLRADAQLAIGNTQAAEKDYGALQSCTCHLPEGASACWCTL